MQFSSRASGGLVSGRLVGSNVNPISARIFLLRGTINTNHNNNNNNNNNNNRSSNTTVVVFYFGKIYYLITLNLSGIT
jgi:hypothetical protein